MYDFRFAGVGHHRLCPAGVDYHPVGFLVQVTTLLNLWCCFCLSVFVFTKQRLGHVVLTHGITRTQPKVVFLRNVMLS